MAQQHELFRQGALTAWYEAAKPALYVNKTLREWLHTYAEAQRPEAVKLALIYGVTCLRKSFGNKCLSLADLRLATEKGQCAVVLSEELPAVKDGMAEIHQMLQDFHQKLSVADMVEPQYVSWLLDTFLAVPELLAYQQAAQLASPF